MNEKIKTAMSKKIYLLGELSGYRSSGGLQNFYSLRDKHLNEHTLFEDELFPANDTSVCYTPNIYGEVVWKRPKEVCDNPKLFVDGHSRKDAIQGDQLGDCWVIAAIANLASYEELLHFVMPSDQNFDDKYAGIFHFRFWQYGKWVDVVIDDRLPFSIKHNKLFSMRCNETNEFWAPLLEKAYAKLHGSYEALNRGRCSDAMQDFTGGITEIFRIDEIDTTSFYELLRISYEAGAMLSCSLRRKLMMGIYGEHAYGITSVKYVQKQGCSEKIPLIRLRNPWGTFEWKGDWSDSSRLWNSVSEDDKKALGYVKMNEGEFWMAYSDFEKNCVRVEICHRSPLPVIMNQISNIEKDWKVSFFEGRWIRDCSAGGRLCLECFPKVPYCRNPQYRITLTEPDKGSDKCTIIVGLLQKLRRQQKHLGIKNLGISFDVYRLDTPDNVPAPLDAGFFKTNESIVKYVCHEPYREYTRRLEVEPGTYCVIPNAHDENEEGDFLIRIFSAEDHVFQEHDEDVTYDQYNINKQVIDVCSAYETDEDNQVTHLFEKFAGDGGTINWHKLKLILDFIFCSENKNVNFSKDVCKSLLAVLDVDQSGELSLSEFQALWKDVQHWKTVFRIYDKDKSDALSPFELRNALNSVGFTVNTQVLNLLMQRFRNEKGELILEDFIAAAVKLKTLINIFKEESDSETGKATFTLDRWLQVTLYN